MDIFYHLIYLSENSQCDGSISPSCESLAEQRTLTPSSDVSLLFSEPNSPMGSTDQNPFAINGSPLFAPQYPAPMFAPNWMTFSNDWDSSVVAASPVQTTEISEDQMIISRWDEKDNNDRLEHLTRENEIKWGEKEFGCRECNDNRTYSLRSLLKKHVKCHASPQFACAHPQCAHLVSDRREGWTRKKDAIRHYRSKHLPGGFVCRFPNCGKSFSRKDNFNDHQSRRGHGSRGRARGHG